MPLADDVLDVALRSTDPRFDTTELSDVLDELGHAITAVGLDDVRRRPRSRRFAMAGGAAALVALVAIGGPAAASWVGLHTGLFGAAGQTENDTSEWLRADSPEIGTVVDQAATRYALPPGGSHEALKQSLMRNGGLIQASGVEMSVASNAACQWKTEWLTANAAGDVRRQSAAASILEAVPTWEVVGRFDGGGVVDLHRKIAGAARAGDRATVASDVRLNCPGVGDGNR